MAMNYVGSVSILDRGDAPAQSVLDRNARSLAQRVADETKEDLAKVMQRVDHIYGNFELSTNLIDSNRAASIEYANDLAELEEIVRDQVKKKKYQQQVTIFIVGYENVSGQKLRLLQQVNEFFMEHSNKFEEEDTLMQTPDLELDDMAEVVEETLKTTEDLSRRLGELNKEMVEYMYNYAQAKASNNPYEFQMMQQKIMDSRGKKKLERALGQARDDMNNLQEKLQALQTELEDRDEKMQQLYKQIEIRNMEAQRYKTAAEVAKRNAEESDRLRDDIQKRDERIKELRQNIDKLEIELGQAVNAAENTTNRLEQAKNESTDKLQSLQQQLEDSTIEGRTAREELERLHSRQVDEIKEEHKSELEDMKLQHAEEIKKLLDKLRTIENRFAELQQFADARAESADVAKHKLAEVTLELDDALIQKEKAEHKLQKCKNKLEDAWETQQDARRQTKDAMRDLSTARRSLIDAKRKVKELQTHNEELRQFVSKATREAGPEAPVLAESREVTGEVTREVTQVERVASLISQREETKMSELSRLTSEHSAAHQAQLTGQSTSGPAPKPLTPRGDARPDTSDSVSLKSGDNGHVIQHVVQPKELISEPGDRSRPVTKEKGKMRAGVKGAGKNAAISEDAEEEDKVKESKRVATVREPDVLEFDDVYELMDEESWTSIPSNHAVGRFNQYRDLAYKKISTLEDKIEDTVKKTHRKIQTLKAQFQEHKRKWEMEREALLQHIDTAVSLHEQAEQEADAAMSQLSSFISEQEHLEKEEESKRVALSGATSRQTNQEADKPLEEEPDEEAPPLPDHEDTLLSQTDDAKADQLSKKSGSNLQTPAPAEEDPALTPRSLTGSKRGRSVSFTQEQPLIIQTGNDEPEDDDIEPEVFADEEDKPETPLEFLREPSRVSSKGIKQYRRGSTLEKQYTVLETIRAMLSGEAGLTEVQKHVLREIRAAVGRLTREGSTPAPPGEQDPPGDQDPPGYQDQPRDTTEVLPGKVEAPPREPSPRERSQDKTQPSSAPSLPTDKKSEKDMNKTTLTLFSLASALVEETLAIGIEPNSFFQSFASIISRDLSALAQQAGIEIEKIKSSPEAGQTEVLMRRVTQSSFISNTMRELSKSFTKLSEKLSKSQSFDRFPTQATFGSVEHRRLYTQSTFGRDPTKQSSELSDIPPTPSPVSHMSRDDAATFKGKELRGSTPDELARSSAQSRASLREQHRTALSSLKASAEARRSRSPSVLSVRDQKSVLADAELDEDGDMPFPPDETKEEREEREARERKLSMHDIGTSPMTLQREKTSDTMISNPFSLISRSPTVPEIKIKSDVDDDVEDDLDRKAVPMFEHPVVQEFLKAYDGVVNFKENLSKVFMDRDITSAGQILNDIEPLELNKDNKVQPQLEAITKQIYEITEECAGLIANLMTNDRPRSDSHVSFGPSDYVVSSVANFSADPTRISMFGTREPTAASSVRVPSIPPPGPTETELQIQALQEKYLQLQTQFDGEKKKYDNQLQHNTVVMMEMQDTINALQREISTLGRGAPGTGVGKPQPSSTPPPDSPIMFTRLDSERNAKVMKKAVNEKRLSVSRYQGAVDTMHEYTSLPAKRFVSLVHKYIHHHQMKEIEENVRKSNAIDNSVYTVLNRMESLQNDRAKRWADRMDEMTEERLRLAGMLMDTLDDIEKESGIFLIKPVYTYRAPYNPDKFKGKLSRPYRPPPDLGRAVSSIAPAPTPASQHRPYPAPGPYPASTQPTTPGRAPESDPLPDLLTPAPPVHIETGIAGKASQLIGEYPRPVWMPTVAQSKPLEPGEEKMAIQFNSLNTPRMLELDINRMLIGQNQISAKIQPNFLSNDRIANAANSTVRNYVTVNRSLGKGSHEDRPRSHTGISENAAPPTTPLHNSAYGRRQRSPPDGASQDPDRAPSRTIIGTSPLPPITPRDQELPIPPMSPPGSSLRQTPPASAGMA